MLKNYPRKKIILTALICVSTVWISCKDNIVNNVYLNLTENLRYEDNYEVNQNNNLVKIRVRDFYTGENISGAKAALIFPNGLRISQYSGIKGIIEIDRSTIPQDDFDISICFSKDNKQYFLKQRIFYAENFDRVINLYLIPGICELKIN